MITDYDEDEMDEERPKGRRHYFCSDRMCGGSDCENCFPFLEPTNEDDDN